MHKLEGRRGRHWQLWPLSPLPFAGCPRPCSTTAWTIPSQMSEVTGGQLGPPILQQERKSPRRRASCRSLLPGAGGVLTGVFQVG